MRERSLLLSICLVFASQAAEAAGDAAIASSSRSLNAQRNFTQYCSGCHLADGSGSPAKGIPSLVGHLDSFLLVPGGREFIVQAPGVMNSPLNDAQIADLMNWLLPHTAGQTTFVMTRPYTGDEVAKLRPGRPVDAPEARRAIVDRARTAGISLE